MRFSRLQKISCKSNLYHWVNLASLGFDLKMQLSYLNIYGIPHFARNYKNHTSWIRVKGELRTSCILMTYLYGKLIQQWITCIIWEMCKNGDIEFLSQIKKYVGFMQNLWNLINYNLDEIIRPRFSKYLRMFAHDQIWRYWISFTNIKILT